MDQYGQGRLHDLSVPLPFRILLQEQFGVQLLLQPILPVVLLLHIRVSDARARPTHQREAQAEIHSLQNGMALFCVHFLNMVSQDDTTWNGHGHLILLYRRIWRHGIMVRCRTHRGGTDHHSGLFRHQRHKVVSALGHCDFRVSSGHQQIFPIPTALVLQVRHDGHFLYVHRRLVQVLPRQAGMACQMEILHPRLRCIHGHHAL